MLFSSEHNLLRLHLMSFIKDHVWKVSLSAPVEKTIHSIYSHLEVSEYKLLSPFNCKKLEFLFPEESSLISYHIFDRENFNLEFSFEWSNRKYRTNLNSHSALHHVCRLLGYFIVKIFKRHCWHWRLKSSVI